MIRMLRPSDTCRVMELWLGGNEDAHPFVPKAYWRENYPMVREALSQASVYVYEEEGEILGFIGILDGYIAGLFVDGTHRSEGIGGQLLDYVKQRCSTLTLNVYEKNGRAAAFYRRAGFFAAEKGTDENTGEADFTMIWER